MKRHLHPYFFILMLSLFTSVMTSCSTPESKMAEFVEDGFEKLEKNQSVEALTDFKEALKIYNENKRALWGLSLAYEQIGDFKHMFQFCRLAAEVDKSDVEINLKLANLYLIADNKAAVFDQIKRLDAADKNNPEVIAFKAEVELRYGDAATAKQLADLALSKDAKNSSAFMTLAKIASANGDFTEAIKILDQAISYNPKTTGLYLAKLSIMKDTNETALMPQVYKRLIELNPQNLEFKKELALLYVRQAQYSEAEVLLKDTLRNNPNNIESQMGLVKLTSATRGKQPAVKLLNSFVAESPNSTELLFAEYEFLKEIGEYESAMRVIKSIVDKSKELGPKYKAISLMADDVLNQGYREEAEKLISGVLIKDSKNTDALLVKAKLHMFDKNFSAAISIYRNILDDYPNSILALQGLGQAYEHSNAIELANEVYYEAFRLAPMVEEVRNGYIRFLFDHKKDEAAVKFMQDMVRKSPGNFDLVKQLALLKIEVGDDADVQKMVEQLTAIPKLAGLGYQIQGKLYDARGKKDLALKAYLSAYQTDKSQVYFVLDVVNAYLSNADNKNAMDFLNIAVKNKPNDYDLSILLGALIAKRDANEGEHYYQSLIQKYPNRPEVYAEFAKLLLARGAYQETEPLLLQAVKAMPDSILLQSVLAELYLKQKAYDKALVIFNALLKKNPNDTITKNNLAGLLLDYGKNQNDINRGYYLAQSFVISEIPAFKDTLAWGEFKQGKYDDALLTLNAVIKQSPNQAVFYYHLYRIYTAMGNQAQAKAARLKAKQYQKANDGLFADNLDEISLAN